jgi:hypothetical protein
MLHAPLKDMLTIQMDPITVALAVVAALSEILPLLGFTKVNGVLHGMKHLFMHIHADSECHLNVEVEGETQE